MPESRTWMWWLLMAVPLVVVSPLLGPTGQEYTYLAAGLGATAAVVHGVRRNRPARPLGWLLLAGALAAGVLANAIWAVQLTLGASAGSDISPSDVLYLVMYLGLAAGLAVLAERRSRASRWAGMTEAGIVACTGTVLAWTLLYDPLVHDSGRAAPSTSVMSYPLVDLLLICMATRLLASQRRLTRAHLMLLTSAVLLSAADVLYFVATSLGGSWSGPQLSAVGWTAAFATIGAAALHPSVADRAADRPARHRGRWSTPVHVTLVLIGPVATMYTLLDDHRTGDLDIFDFGLPLAATAVIALLLVSRMSQANRVAEGHAAELEHSALHDALTGLPNRRRLEEQVGATETGALLLLDLDGFKDVNDRLGHAVGDVLLIEMADRLRRLLGPDEVLARPGGDEFGILLPGVGPAALTARGEAFLAALRRPVEAGGHTLHVTGSAGLRVLEPGASATDTLADADLALYAAKAAGKDCVVLFDPRLRDDQAERVRIVERLRHSLDAGEFAVHYQPIIALDSGAPVAVEALVRWPHAGPDTFIPAAEEGGLIVRLGEWVLRRACADTAAWHHRHGTTVAVNVSPRQLTDPDFTEKVHRALADSGLPATALTLEITEGVLVRAGSHAEQALAHLNTLRAEGIRVAIDDFGTGYSSLSYLRDLPIDVLKIDRSFMPADRTDVRQEALVRAVVDLARSLDLTTVAEGVETVHHADLLRELGCDRGQGYLFARPAPAADITARLAQALSQPVEAAGLTSAA